MNPRKTGWILWAGLCFGVLSMALVAAALNVAVGPLRPGPDPALDSILPMIGGAQVGLGFLILILAMKREPASKSAEVERLREKLLAVDASSEPDRIVREIDHLGIAQFRNSFLVAWALAEGGALLALVHVMLRGPRPVAIVILALWLAFMLFAMPTTRRSDDFIEKRLRAAGLGPEQAREILVRAAGRRDR